MRDTTPELVVTARPFDEAAQRIAHALERIAGADGRVRLAIPGGSAAAAARQAVDLLRAREFDFERLFVTWVDERCVPSSSRDSNRGATPFQPAPGVELRLFIDDERPAEAVRRVQSILETRFEGALDVVLLGMGDDGHIASLFVGRPAAPGLVAHVADSPKPPAHRITLTRAMLATAQHTLLVAAGESKRAAVTRLARGDANLPATGLPGLVIYTDREIEGAQ